MRPIRKIFFAPLVIAAAMGGLAEAKAQEGGLRMSLPRKSEVRVMPVTPREYAVRYTQIISQAGTRILLMTIAVLSLVPAQDRPVTGVPHLAEHFSIFLVMGLAFGVGYLQRRLFQFVTLLAFTAAIELAQLLVPGRHARLSDFLVDALGVTVGLSIGFIASKLAQK